MIPRGKCQVEQHQLATRKRKESGNSASTTVTSSGINSELDIQIYLTSEQRVDREVFMSLPRDMREELVRQWKSQRKQQ